MINRLNKSAIIDRLVLSCLFVIFLSVSYYRYYQFPQIIITADVKGYYIYLPTIFIYKDIHNVQEPFMGQRFNEKGERYSKYSCGVAYCYLPFFFAAHLYAKIFHFERSGFSPPYSYAILIAGACWSTLGLYFLKKILLQYFSRGVTWLTILCIVFGTNFYCYATLFNGWSHIYSFALFAAAILLVDNYYKFPSTPKAILLAVLVGWIILIRPTNAPIIIFIMLYRVVNVADLKQRLQFFKSNLSQLVISVPFSIAIVFPQMLFWKEMTGQWIKYSYSNERFIYWNHPKILSVLFDVQNGWLLYSPIMLFLFWALAKRSKDPRTNFWATAIILVVSTYTFASWWVWTFHDAFGHRCYIDYYPLLAFPFAVTMERCVGLQNNYFRVLFFSVVAVLCYYSVGMANIYVNHGMAVWTYPEWRWNYGKWWGVVKQLL